MVCMDQKHLTMVAPVRSHHAAMLAGQPWLNNRLLAAVATSMAAARAPHKMLTEHGLLHVAEAVPTYTSGQPPSQDTLVHTTTCSDPQVPWPPCDHAALAP